MQKRITGFHQDEHKDWVAQLECGHNQHVRHNPPWTNRPWVMKAEARAEKIGEILNCVKCRARAPSDEIKEAGAKKE